MSRGLRAAIATSLALVAVVGLLLLAALHGIDARCHRDPTYPGCSAPPTERSHTP